MIVSKSNPVSRALQTAFQFGGIQGDHHKAWVIDQMVRALTGCLPGIHESQAYKQFVQEATEDDHDWDVGIPP